MTELESELAGYQKDRAKNLLELAAQQRKYAQMLQSTMGQDMMDVLTGKVKVVLTDEEKKKNKSSKFWTKVKNFFRKWA